MLILMCGISGSGKTRQARRLEKSGFIRLSIDNIMWDRHGEQYMHLPPQQQRPLQLEAENELKRQLGTLLDAGRDVVVDSCLCKRFKRDEYRRIAQSHGVDCMVFYCSAEPDELRARLQQRYENPGPDCALVSEEMLNGFLAGFQPPEADETDVILSIEDISE